MKKKLIALSVALVLFVSALLGGTYAFLIDTDYDKNVMVVGNVEIQQIEKDRNDNDFVQNQKLLPAVYTTAPVAGDNTVWDSELTNEIDKFVSVKNTGSEKAYIRTIFLFEDDLGEDGIDLVHCNYNNDDGQGLEWLAEPVEIGGVDFYVAYATYDTEIDNGETTPVSLKQIYLDASAGNEWFNGVGNQYDIHVFSQAVQYEGFANAKTALNTAFGEVTADNVIDWYNEINANP